MASWSDGYWWSNDGLRLHYRDYPGRDDRPPILCLPGLTRNARDFEAVADRLAGDWRLIVVELRGRGESAYAKDAMSYVPLAYLQDLEALVRTLALARFVAFGTSLGGLMTMLMASAGSERIAGALLNDVGPTLEAEGLARVRGYVGRAQSWPTWLHAARHFAEALHEVYPRWKLDQWLIFAKRLCKLGQSGRIMLDYDMRVAEPFKLPAGPTGFDTWPAFRALSGKPLLVVRGARSDLLSAAGLDAMAAELPNMESVIVPDVGHAPTLEEPEAAAAIDRLLERIDAATPRPR